MWWEKHKKNIITAIIIFVVSFILGFVYGWIQNKNRYIYKVETEYVQGESIIDTVYFEKPYKVVEPIDTADIITQCVRDGVFFHLFPEKVRDSIIYVTREDTTKIMADWASKKYYDGTLFDDNERGKFTYDIEVQYNELKNMDYSFTPVQKVVTNNVTKVKRYSPFVGLGVSTNSSLSGALGVFIDDSWGASINGSYMIQYRENEPLTKYNVGLMVYKKF